MKKTAPRWSVCSLLALSLISLNAVPANAWGASGHRIVAIIAERNLTAEAQARVTQILGQNVSLASVANYADAIRNRHQETKNFHFVDIPKNRKDYSPARDCQPTKKGDCIIAALERFKADVVNPQKTLAERRFALKFIVHLVGDMHQPLHCADNHDVGGNNVSVKWFGKSTDLHKVWDTLIIEEAELTDTEFADALDSDLSQQQIQVIQQGTPVEWALEAHEAARSHAYVIPANRLLSHDYYDANARVVDEQLLRGGLRLAKLLNTIFQ